MTALPPLTPIANGTPNDAVPVDTNFDLIADHINGELINRDGSLAMTSELTLSSSTPSAALVAASKAYVDNVTIYTANIAAGNVTNAKIAANAVTATQINAGAVLEGKLADGAVTNVKIGASPGGTVGEVNYRKLGDMVFVWGRATGDNDTLPAGYRPAAQVQVAGIQTDQLARQVVIGTDGLIVVSGSVDIAHFSAAYVAA